MTVGPSVLVVGPSAAVERAAREAVSRVVCVADPLAMPPDGAFDLVLVCDAPHDDVLTSIGRQFPESEVVIVGNSERPEHETILLPLDHGALVDAIASSAKAAMLRDRAAGPAISSEIVVASKPMVKLMASLRKAAAGTATVLLRGETGTGKEVLARALHEASPRASKPFVAVHCAAMPDALLESELFGHERGAFTGALSRRPGRVALAEGGTLFFDEVGDLTAPTQVKLLRLLQERTYEPLGANRTAHADVRFVAATHRDLEALVQSGGFREDLFYRLSVIPIWVPPLRSRRDDIGPMARRFVTDFGRANGRTGIRIDDDAIELLRAQRWPGNVRELANLIERLVVLGEGDRVRANDVNGEVLGSRFATETTLLPRAKNPSEVRPLDAELRETEKHAIVRALAHTKNNRSLAARMLGVSRATLYNKLEEHGLA